MWQTHFIKRFSWNHKWNYGRFVHMFVETSDEIENQNLPSVGQDVLLEFALNENT